MTSNNNIEWIKTDLVHRIVENNCSLKGWTVEYCSVTALETMKDNWASMMFEINMTLRQKKDRKSVVLLVKLMHEHENVRIAMKSEKQFFNEIHFYSAAIPYFISRVRNHELRQQFEDLFPKCFYSFIVNSKKPESPRDGILVMENLKTKKYKLGNRTFLDLNHCTLAMKHIGVFHAFSYFMKNKDMEAFLNMAQPIEETNYDIEGRKTINAVFGVSEHRVLDALARELPEDDPGLTKLRAIADRGAFDVFIELATPKEPLAVLCHGDFLRNNVLFRYEGDVPVDMKLIDFQTVRYASPAIDISLFLCMNTSRELRATHFMHLLRVYHESMRRMLTALLGQPEEQLPARHDFNHFLEDFRRHAYYGYLIAIEFFPWMLVKDEELAEIVHLNWTERGSEKYNECAKKLGGEEVTQVLVDLAMDFILYDCL